ncbi:MAG: ketoacyl-ACP synthase III [Desulfovibrionaceae bacterium]|nr:ketoacyl-ACP synthase III [Desulfovibrionaceae bacterium]
MAIFTVNNVEMVACAVTLGECHHVIDDEPQYYEKNPVLLHRLKSIVGMGERYVAAPDTSAADLCHDAAHRLLEAVCCPPSSIGAIVSVTQTPDQNMPGNAHVLHHRLGLSKTASAHDLNMGCSGFVYGLSVAAMLAEHGVDNILLVAGDTLSHRVDPADRAVAPLFGDAGCATLLRYMPGAEPLYFLLGADGDGLDVIQMPTEGGFFSMNGYEVFRFSMLVQPDMLTQMLEYSGHSQEQIDYFVFHQANRYIVHTVASKAGISEERVPSDIFSRYGNLSSVSIPAVLCGSLADKLACRKSKVVLQGFGVGLSWAACQITLNMPLCLAPLPLRLR